MLATRMTFPMTICTKQVTFVKFWLNLFPRPGIFTDSKLLFCRVSVVKVVDINYIFKSTVLTSTTQICHSTTFKFAPPLKNLVTLTRLAL